MEDSSTGIDKEPHWCQQNNAWLQRQEDDHWIITNGQGKMSLSTSQQQDTDCSPVGLRKAKTTTLKNTSKFLGSMNL